MVQVAIRMVQVAIHSRRGSAANFRHTRLALARCDI
jgi:hypothetical protein